jgi:hypothetical protein
MSFSTDNSAVKVPAGSELARAISQAASVSEIQNLLHAAAVSQHLIYKDPLDLTGQDYFSYHAVAAGSPAAARGFAKTISVDGQKIILESPTEEGLVQEELKVMRALFDKPADTEQTRDSNGRFVAQPSLEEIEAEAARVATIDPAAAALSSTVTAALEAAGISVNDLREFSQNKQGEVFQQSWEQATTEFRNSPEAADWVGGEKNFQILSDLIASTPAWLSQPSASTISAAWTYMKETNRVVDNPELTTRDAIQKAQTFDELKNAVGYRGADGSSGLWGR